MSEPPLPEIAQESFSPAWRADVQRQQRAALESGPTVASSTGPYGVGGLGRHLAELVEALRHKGDLSCYFSPAPRPEDVGSAARTARSSGLVRRLATVPPLRFSHSARLRLGNAGFDAAASRALPPANHLVVFNGHARRHIRIARERGYRSVALVSANSHMAHVARRHDKAYEAYPIERPWGRALLKSNLAEYQAADLVHVSSRYAWGSFVDEGFPEDRLRFFPLTPHPRFARRLATPTVDTFNVVYVGSLAVHKGVPLLIDAFRRLRHRDLRLILVGGWGTRGMRRFVEQACASDSRVSVRPGDPLPHLQQAGVCVHPSYEDGFGYAPAEALATGVPVIVSEDTGMNELVRSPDDGVVVSTGDLQALATAIDAAYRGSRRPSLLECAAENPGERR